MFAKKLHSKYGSRALQHSISQRHRFFWEYPHFPYWLLFKFHFFPSAYLFYMRLKFSLVHNILPSIKLSSRDNELSRFCGSYLQARIKLSTRFGQVLVCYYEYCMLCIAKQKHVILVVIEWQFGQIYAKSKVWAD